MIITGVVVRDRYQDSVRLMRITEALTARSGIDAAGVIAATPANTVFLRDNGLWFTDLASASPNDIALVVRAVDAETASIALGAAVAMLDAAGAEGGRTTYSSTDAALVAAPADAIGFIATPGSHAAIEARRFLASGRSVVVFSDNVPLEDERALKEEAHQRGLLVMGPDAGTVSLGGLGLGFCNALPAGRVGIVAASGTGAQLVASLLAGAGEGVTSIIGLGGRDTSDEVGGISLIDALQAMDADPATDVVIVIAKGFGPRTAMRFIRRLAAMSKPVVTLSPGWSTGWVTAAAGAHPAYTAAEAAELALGLLHSAGRRPAVPAQDPRWSGIGTVRGLFAGGTIAQEARAALQALASLIDVDASRVDVVDLGDDAFTRGRPHPMISPSIVADAITRVGRDPAVGAVVFDVVLGYGGHPDPVSVLVPAVEAVLRDRRTSGAPPCVAVLCGTDGDPQDVESAHDRLVRAGAVVVRDPMSAAAVLLVGSGERGGPPGRWSLGRPSAVINVGTDWFVDALEAQQVTVAHVEWRPPAGGDDELNDLLARLM